MNTRAMRKDFWMEIRKSPGRFLSIFFIVALGTSFFSGIRSAQPDMLITGDSYFDGARLMDVKAVSTLGITEDDIAAVEALDGVQAAEGGYSVDVMCRQDDVREVLHVMSFLPSMNAVELTEGRLPEEDWECVVDDETEYRIGDIILMESGTEEPVTDFLTTNRLKVVGRGSSPCYISFGRGNTEIGTGSIEGFAVVRPEAFRMEAYTEMYVAAKGAKELQANSAPYDERIEQTIDEIESITGERGEIRRAELTKEARAKISEARESLEEGRKEARAKSEAELADGERELEEAEEQVSQIGEAKWYVDDRSVLPEYSGYGENADRMKAIGRVFPVLFFLVAALISLTCMTRMVEEQRTQIGTMKALGYGRFAIASRYLGYAFAAALGGSIFGVLAGEKIIPYIIVYAYGIVYHHIPEIIVPYNLPYALAAAGTAILCTTGATFFACYKELRAQPAVLMRPPAPKNGKRVFLERITFLWKHLSFTWKSTFRNLFRYKKRFLMTILGIGGCMALILVGFGLRDSIFEIARLQYKEIQVYDGMAYLRENVPQSEMERLENFMESSKLLEDDLKVGMSAVTLARDSREWDVYLCVPEDTGKLEDFVKLHSRLTKEEYVLKDNGVILNEKAARMLRADVGDTLEIEGGGPQARRVRIAAICENYMGHYMYMSGSLYEKIYGKSPEMNCIYFKTPDGSESAVEQIGGEILQQDAVFNVTYLRDIERQLNDMLKSLNLVILVLIVSAGMLAFVVLYNLNHINITERRRELATLKVLGFYDPEVSVYVYRENILLTVVGAIAGAGLGILLHRFIIETVEIDSVMFGRVIHSSSYILSVALTFVFSGFVNWMMYFKLKGIDMIESLKSVE